MSPSLILKTVKVGMKVGGRWAMKNLPTILTAVGTIGVVIGVVEAAKSAPAAKEELDEVTEEWEALEDNEKRSKADYIFKKVRVGLKHYGVTILIVGGSIVCFWVAHRICWKRLSAALILAATQKENLKDLEDKIKEKDGEKTLKTMKDEIAGEKAKEAFKNPEDRPRAISPEVLMYEPLGKHRFVGTYERIQRAVLKVRSMLDSQLSGEDSYAFVALNEFLMECSDDSSIQCPFGELLGFSVQLPDCRYNMREKDVNELILDAINVTVTSVLLDDGFTPATALVYNTPPKHAYEC